MPLLDLASKDANLSVMLRARAALQHASTAAYARSRQLESCMFSLCRNLLTVTLSSELPCIPQGRGSGVVLDRLPGMRAPPEALQVSDIL